MNGDHSYLCQAPKLSCYRWAGFVDQEELERIKRGRWTIRAMSSATGRSLWGGRYAFTLNSFALPVQAQSSLVTKLNRLDRVHCHVTMPLPFIS